MEAIMKVNGAVIDFVYYCGVSTLRWNPVTKKVFQSRSKRITLQRLAIISTLTLFQIYMVVDFALEKMKVPFSVHRLEDPWRIIMTGIYLVTGVIHWHQYRLEGNIGNFFNEVHLYFCAFSAIEDKNKTNDGAKRVNIIAFITTTQIILLILLSFGSALFYFSYCELHIFAQVLPVCEPGTNGYYSIAWLILMSLAQIIFFFCCVTATFIPTALGVTLIIGGLDLMKKIRWMKDVTIAGKYKWWSQHYRCIQIVLNEAKICVIPLIPYILSFLMGLHIIMLYCFIVQVTPITFRIVNVFAQFMVAVYYYFLPFLAYRLTETAKSIVVSEAKNCGKRVYKSFAPITIPIGSFGHFNSLTLVTMLEAVFSETIDLVLMN